MNDQIKQRLESEFVNFGPYEQFMQRVNKTETCWLWTGPFGKQRRAIIHQNGKRRIAARVLWEIINGPIPEGMCVCHTCDNGTCVNPAHLWLGTTQENTQDMLDKGRQWNQKKTHCDHGHEFTPENTRIDKNGKRNCRKCQAHTSLKAHYNKYAALKHRILELEHQLKEANDWIAAHKEGHHHGI